MPRRNKQQWLEMIARTQPTMFAVAALAREFTRNAGQDGLSQSEALEVRAALERLEQAVLEQERQPTPAASDRPQAAIEYRPHGAGGKGRLFLEIEGKTQLEPLEHPVLDELQVYVMLDPQGFAGLQVDNATSLPERLEPTLTALRMLDLPRVDCLEAGLENASVADVLAWAVRHRVMVGR